MNDDDVPVTRVSEPYVPRQRRPALLRIFGKWFLSILLLTVVIGGALGWAWFDFTAPGPLTQKKIVQLPKTADRAAIAVALKEQGVITDATIFSAAAALNEYRHAKLKTGEYEFPAGASMADVLSTITRGAFVTYKVTVPEGWTSQMVVNRLNEQEQMDGTIAQVPAEGSLLPETYIVTRGYSREKLLGEMAAAQTKLLDQEWSRLPPDNGVIATKNDLVTLASIVEKETGVAEERPLVASIFINRLKQHMRLQSDPTVIYGIVGGKGKLDHPLTRTELDTPNPYNTYAIDGLPAGPIANPGKAAIEAVLNPAPSSYLYFVANGSGGHAFATSLEEHNANVKKWRALNGEAETAAQPAAAAAVKPAVPAAPPVITPTAAPPADGTVKPADAAPRKIPIPRLKKPKP